MTRTRHTRRGHRVAHREGKKLTEKNKHRPPYGEIFAAMMLCCAAGTRLFGFLAESRGPEDFARPLFVVASLFLLAPVVAPSNYVLALVAFLLFEGVVGCYFPALGTLKSKIVPDAQRSTIYNIFRVPLNVLVLLVLLSKLPTQTVFAVSALPLLSAAILQHMLFAAMRGHADVLDARGVDAKRPARVGVGLGVDGVSLVIMKEHADIFTGARCPRIARRLNHMGCAATGASRYLGYGFPKPSEENYLPRAPSLGRWRDGPRTYIGGTISWQLSRKKQLIFGLTAYLAEAKNEHLLGITPIVSRAPEPASQRYNSSTRRGKFDPQTIVRPSKACRGKKPRATPSRNVTPWASERKFRADDEAVGAPLDAQVPGRRGPGRDELQRRARRRRALPPPLRGHRRAVGPVRARRGVHRAAPCGNRADAEATARRWRGAPEI